MEFAPDTMTALVDMLKTGEEDSDSDEDKVNILLLTLMVLEATFANTKISWKWVKPRHTWQEMVNIELF